MKMRETQLKSIRRGADKLLGFCEGLTYPARGRKFPSILVNALPKSGSTFIAKTLRRTLQVRPIGFALHGFQSTGTVNVRQLKLVADGNAVCHQHLPAEPHIVAALGDALGRMVVNIRDPRAALVSWTYFVNEFHREHSYMRALQEAEQVLPQSYFDLPIAEQLAWQTDRRLPYIVEWIGKWLQVADQTDSQLAVLVTDYGQMVHDTRAFIERILSFYNIAIEPQWLVVRQPKAGQWKFRVGTAKDWRADFAPATLERATAMVPQEWMQRFGWD